MDKKKRKIFRKTTHTHTHTHILSLCLSLTLPLCLHPLSLLLAKSWGLLNWFPRGAVRQTVWWECWAVMSPHPSTPNPPITTPLWSMCVFFFCLVIFCCFFFPASRGPNWSKPGQKDALLWFQMQTSWQTRSGCSARARRPGVLVLLGATLAVWAQRNTHPLRSMLQNMCSCTWQPLNPVKLMDGPLTLDWISPLFPLL